MQRLDSQYLLLTTLKGSLNILGWSCVLLLAAQTLIALAIFFYLKETYFLEDYPVQERRDVFRYFGSFSRAVLSMFELTLANRTPARRLMAENASEWFVVFFLARKLAIGFAVVGVIGGALARETLEVASSDDGIVLRQREREVSTDTEKMRRLFAAADANRDGTVDAQAFADVMSDPQILHWLASTDLPVRDPGLPFELLDVEGEGVLTAEATSKGALKPRGQAKSIDVLALKKQVDSVPRSLRRAADAKALA